MLGLRILKIFFFLVVKMNIVSYHHAAEDVVAQMGQQKLLRAVFQ